MALRSQSAKYSIRAVDTIPAKVFCTPHNVQSHSIQQNRFIIKLARLKFRPVYLPAKTTTNKLGKILARVILHLHCSHEVRVTGV